MADAITGNNKNEGRIREQIWTKLNPAKKNRVILAELEKWLKTVITKNFQEAR